MTGPELLASLRALIEPNEHTGPMHPVASLSNASALLWQTLPDLNWVGFYLLDQGALWLGPFQGKPACTRIALGAGVCGAAFSRDETILVPDVHAFPGHIACDGASASEIVVPLHRDGRAIGVLDVDSPHRDRFTEEDRRLLEGATRVLESCCDFARCGYSLS
ncbi:GAF domain-containing protein [Eubacteriales bacterium OttesenSCG-928-A19]|nr:GAF domain-containing protein [Eubacteriales bacterium OttesenSCG-928-A19]